MQSTSDDENLYVTAARGDDGYAVMLTHFRVDKQPDEKDVTVRLLGVPDGIWQAELLDSDHTMEVRSVAVENGQFTLQMPHDCVVLLTKDNA